MSRSWSSARITVSGVREGMACALGRPRGGAAHRQRRRCRSRSFATTDASTPA
jgi:hypothetical protein